MEAIDHVVIPFVLVLLFVADYIWSVCIAHQFGCCRRDQFVPPPQASAFMTSYAQSVKKTHGMTPFSSAHRLSTLSCEEARAPSNLWANARDTNVKRPNFMVQIGMLIVGIPGFSKMHWWVATM